MQTLPIRTGIYFVNDIFFQNGEPIANVVYKEPHWSSFSIRSYNVRLRSLYNLSSEGPKHINANDLIFYEITIISMKEYPNPNDSSKMIRQVIWSAYRDEGYNEMVALRNEAILNSQSDEKELNSIHAEMMISKSSEADSFNLPSYLLENDGEAHDENNFNM